MEVLHASGNGNGNGHALGGDVAALQNELSKKQLELQQLQESFDEYTLSSQELEQELEQELTRTEQHNAMLATKSQRLELELEELREKLDTTQHEMRKCETELSALRSELSRVTAIKRQLEQEQDELTTQVRVLQATEDDLRHKMEREMEEKVFLLSDQEELKREHELVTERLRTEILDLKSELFAVQQKNEALLVRRHEEQDEEQDEQVHNHVAPRRLSDASEEAEDRMDVDDDSAVVPRLSTLQERDASDREQQIETLERELAVLGANLHEERDTRDRLELELMEVYESLEQAEAINRDMEETEAQLMAKVTVVSEQNKEIQSLHEEVTTLKMENAALTEENAELREVDARRRDEVMNMDDDEIETLRSQCLELEEAEQQMRDQLEDEQQVSAQLREENDDLVKQAEDNTRMRDHLEAQLDAQVKKKQKELEELSELNTTLRRQLESAAEKAVKLEEKASAVSMGSTSSSTTSSSSTGDKSSPGAATNEADVRRFMLEIQTLRSTIKTLEAENARLRKSESSSSALLPNKRVSTDLLKLNYTSDQLAEKYLAERTRNAALLSRLQTVCGNIQVFCRVRPVIGEEWAKSYGSKLGVNVVNQSDVAALDIRPDRIFPGADGNQPADADTGDLEMLDMNAAWKVFTFDRVIGPEETQLDVFREVEPIAQSVVEGFKACIFTYGQTGSGKTYTMEGTESDPGLNYRVISHIFQSVVLRGAIYDPDRMEEDLLESEILDGQDRVPRNEVSFHIQVGVLEIYNESLRDLVDPKNTKTLEIRQDPTTGDIVVPQLTMATASSPEKTIEILRNAQANRVTGRTDVHDHSSRSHSIVILQISTRTTSTPNNQGDSDELMGSYVSGKLYMVDLAGSERVKKSNVSGTMLKEAAHINKSLSALADVMEALDKKQAHVPYRNSKLTYLLQDVLNTSCKTVMIVNCGPTIECASETFRSLQLAERVRNIVVGRNSIVKNKKDILSAKRAFSEIQSLKQQIQLSERKIKQSQQTVVSLKRDKKTQSDQVTAALQSRLKAAETQATNLKTQAETMKRINEDLAQQFKQEREAKQKESDQREAAQRALRQLTTKTRVNSSHQEHLEHQLKEREEEVKKLRHMLTEARQRTATSVIPRLKAGSPAPAKKARSEQVVEPENNQEDTEEMMVVDDVDDHKQPPRSAPAATTSSTTRIPLPKYGFTRQASASVASSRKPAASVLMGKSDGGSAVGSKFRRTTSSSSQGSTAGSSSVQRRGWK